MLTARQAQVLDLIEQGIARNGVAPSYREMAAQLGVLSISNIFKQVQALEERGFVEKGERSSHRSLKVIRPQTHLNPEYHRGFKDGYEAGYNDGLGKMPTTV
jgi:SOS-response transcriptional repressor LexA